jgi:hypothetical protein
MGIGTDAAHVGGIDEMRAIGALNRKPRRRRGAGLTEAAERR